MLMLIRVFIANIVFPFLICSSVKPDYFFQLVIIDRSDTVETYLFSIGESAGSGIIINFLCIIDHAMSLLCKK